MDESQALSRSAAHAIISVLRDIYEDEVNLRLPFRADSSCVLFAYRTAVLNFVTSFISSSLLVETSVDTSENSTPRPRNGEMRSVVSL